MKFCGDIIITDPCYILKKRDESDRPKWEDFHPYPTLFDYPDYDAKTRHSEMFYKNYDLMRDAMQAWDDAHPDDADICEYFYRMDKLGINTYIARDTIYGDWSCTTFDTDTGEPIGRFCADAGWVAVLLLDEVLAYNPDFDYHITRPWTTTLIKNFNGEVDFVEKTVCGVYEEDTEWWHKGDRWEEHVVEVVGHGVNAVNGAPINFVGKQSGL